MVSQPSNKWNFAEPDFSQFSTWDKVSPKDLQPGDLVACVAATRRAAGRGGVISRVMSNTSLGSGAGVVIFQTVYGDVAKNNSRSCQWLSLTNRTQYRLFTPQPKPEPVAEAPVAADVETPAPSLTAIAGVDAGLATQNALLREQNKVLCALLSGMSATVDTLSEIKEIMAEAWGTKK